ncbi:MAG: hypothetical protein HOP34_00055 [Methylococcaceae bacterium]|nr:hypothetical protein [Methylococcaceae bacterium]
MHILIFSGLILLACAAVWASLQPKEKLQATWEEISTPFTGKKKDWSTPLKSWAKASLVAEPELQKWLLSLSAEGLQGLGEKLGEFCADMNVNLDWLHDAQAKITPEAKKAAEETMIDYCKMCQKAVKPNAK